MTECSLSRPRAESLTGARFVAACLVLGFHLLSADPVPRLLQRVTTFGRCGVCFFFVLSGFVMTMTYARTFENVALPTWKKFMLARGCRILPMHVLALLIITPLALRLMRQDALPSVSAVSISGAFQFRVWLANLFLVQVYRPRTAYGQMFNAPAWSVSCEVFFYLCFPFLIAGLQKAVRSTRQAAMLAGGFWLLEAAAIFTLIHWLQPPHGKLDEHTFDFCVGRCPPIRIGEFAVGCCAGLAFQWQNRLGPIAAARANRLLLFAGAALVAGFLATGALPYFKFTFWTLAITPGSALLVMGLAGNGHVFRPLLENKLMVLLGESSYALYLLQWTAIVFFRQSRFGVLPLPGLLGIMLGCVVASVLVHVLLERPVCRWLRGRLVDRRDPTGPSSVPHALHAPAS
jgi:peptidoglycan/LPS O-acetylase OafA/YrhL